jgi:hypothetical protein
VSVVGFLSRFVTGGRDAFAADARKIASRAPGVAEVRYDRSEFALLVFRTGERRPVQVFLDNAYGECRGLKPAQRREQLARLVRIMLTPDEEDRSWEGCRARLRPVLRPASFGQVGVTGMVPPISRAALPFLRELIVVDRPESMAYVAPDQVVSWGVTVDEVYATARANLDEIARRSLDGGDWPGPDVLIRMIDNGDGYYTSLLLAPGWLAEVSARMGAPVVAFVPDVRTVMLCAVPEAQGALARIYDVVKQEYQEAVRSLSPVGYVAGEDGRVAPYATTVDGRDRFAARQAEVMLALAEYGAQTSWLRRQYEEAGVDVFVASLVAASKPDDPPFTVANWTDGITSLLPEAQFISFVRDGVSGLMLVPWGVVASLVDLRPEPLLSPVRYRVGDWPAPEIMDRLRARALD